MEGKRQERMMKPPSGKKTRKPVSREAIIRAVATSTALETGESSKTIEARLRKPNPRLRSLKLG
ncbi:MULTISPECIES: hypothetical protein [unclassified Thioalkalivibrio]|uniref:hypothetical protein n=1 Tax=unclassified Thioalkalivibrio TaxID=2621013 RepID=UPI00036EFFFE